MERAIVGSVTVCMHDEAHGSYDNVIKAAQIRHHTDATYGQSLVPTTR